MLAVIGLGNPGKEYERTRHNMGFLVLQALAHDLGVSFRKEDRFEGWRVKASGKELLLPATYMNESGRSAQKLLRYFQIAPSKVLVVVDDMDLPFGQMRLKEFGGSGGHNGLKSLEEHLGTSHFARLKIGIGRPKDASKNNSNVSTEPKSPGLNDRKSPNISEYGVTYDRSTAGAFAQSKRSSYSCSHPKVGVQTDYVLGAFTGEEAKLLPGILESAVSCIKRLFVEEFARVASDVNRTISLTLDKN